MKGTEFYRLVAAAEVERKVAAASVVDRGRL